MMLATSRIAERPSQPPTTDSARRRRDWLVGIDRETMVAANWDGWSPAREVLTPDDGAGGTGYLRVWDEPRFRIRGQRIRTTRVSNGTELVPEGVHQTSIASLSGAAAPSIWSYGTCALALAGSTVPHSPNPKHHSINALCIQVRPIRAYRTSWEVKLLIATVSLFALQAMELPAIP